MAHSSEVTPRLHFVWRTERPYVDQYRESSFFSFVGAEWRFEMHFGGEHYWVNLQKSTEWSNLHPFHVTSWIEDYNREINTITCQRVNVASASENIFLIHEDILLRELPHLKNEGDFTFVCMLHSVLPSGMKKESKHQSIQASLDLPFTPESLSLHETSPPTKVPTSHQSIQVSLEILPHLENLSLDLGNLLEKGIMPDVQLKCGDGIVPAHRSVLTARSEVFSAMFRNDMDESRSGVVDMPDMDFEVLGLLLKYVYTGKLPEASVDLMRRLFVASNKYAIQCLKKACSEWMTGVLNEENYLQYLVLADTHCDAPLKDAVVAFIVDNQGMVFKSRPWLQFQEQQPKLSLEMFTRCFVK